MTGLLKLMEYFKEQKFSNISLVDGRQHLPKFIEL